MAWSMWPKDTGLGVNMNPIEITGLNKRQKILADIIWGIEDWAQVETFINSLSKRDRIDCEGIIEMMRMAIVEQIADELKDDRNKYPEASEVIEKIRRQK